MKKILCLLLIFSLFLCLVLTAFSGCGLRDNGKLKIVVTIYPIYDWVMQVLGDREDDVEVTLLLNSGADMHSYSSSAADMVAIAKADLFIYVGGESDDWVRDSMKNPVNKNRHAMNLLSLLGDRAHYEELVQGMESTEEREEEEEGEYDEHVWLSLRNAAYYVELIAEELSIIDEEYSEFYRENAKAYIAELNALDARYIEMAEASPRDTLIFGDRFPFRYMVEDYGWKYYAAFSGCAAEVEASFATRRFLIDKANELSVNVILELENSSSKLADKICEDSVAKEVKVLDSLQSATKKDYQKGRNYLSVMTSNLETLRAALAQ